MTLRSGTKAIRRALRARKKLRWFAKRGEKLGLILYLCWGYVLGFWSACLAFFYIPDAGSLHWLKLINCALAAVVVSMHLIIRIPRAIELYKRAQATI